MMANDSFYEILFKNSKITLSNVPAGSGTLVDPNCQMTVFSAPIATDSAEYKLLEGIMAACGYKSEGWHLISENTVFDPQTSFPHLQNVLLFGYPEKNLHLNVQFPFYKPITLKGKTFIKSHTLSELIKNPDYKKTLWLQALKPILN